MMVIPSIDIRQGRCVQLVGGDPSKVKVSIDDVEGQVERWASTGASMIHVIDLDAALGAGSNWDTIARLVTTTDVPFQVGGGLRSVELIRRAVDAGVKRVIVGTKAIKDQKWLENVAAEFGDKVVVAVDARGGEVVVSGWTEGSGLRLVDYARSIDKLGLGALFFTDVDGEGKLTGINERLVKTLVEAVETPVIASGGISTMDDLYMLKDLGVDGAVIGMALYTGRIDLRQAVKELES
ncbi:MAG: 1-(5-phosphoribosyl)-5-[(5-phosphoribosylamino)methylideneamino]imidazole-4-carboxamide isomerase [Euryarchaeota archaeon]|nr:1-(5-phosphoribosyl)-5-[(5-phosphoribosylamino)methylideneamino]imidazole-4-carboxamide isomerase [Euryarchaeota archaeon]